MFPVDGMRNLSSRLACVLGLLVFPIVGCSELGDGANGAGAGGSSAAGGTAGVGAAGGTAGIGGTNGTVALFLDAVTASPDGPAPPAKGPPLEGVRVCEMGTENCQTTGANGRVVLDLPANREVAYTLEKEGYGPRVISDVTDENFMSPNFWEMFTDGQLSTIAERIGTPYPWTGGITGLGVGAGNIQTLGGAKLELLDGTGEPFYLEDQEEWLYSPDLTETVSGTYSGFLPLNQGGFAEVAPGVHEFEVQGVPECRASQGWPGSGPNRMRIPIVEGFMTFGSFQCLGN